jgi:hypothetical protein
MLPAPADSPNTVTRAGSPPNAAMCCCTQRSAAAGPGAQVRGGGLVALGREHAKPSAPTRYVIVTTTTSPRAASRAPS